LLSTLEEYDLVAVAGSSSKTSSPDFESWLATRRADVAFLKAGNRYEFLQMGFRLAEMIAGRQTALKIAGGMGFPVEWIEKLLARPRQGNVTRKTKETSIELELSLDGSGKNDISTGIPFFDHMLTQVAVHGLFDLTLQCKGDVQIDPHHTVEDVALALGKAFDQALGERRGLVRMASAIVPMDESLAQVSLDFSGRPYTVVDVAWNDEKVGDLPVTLITHFFESFATQARCNLSIRLLTGGDDHHRAEAIFKALARALDSATQIDPRRLDAVPSSKGVL
jgi:imidazoleglycerol phosphate dehydratase HisB